MNAPLLPWRVPSSASAACLLALLLAHPVCAQDEFFPNSQKYGDKKPHAGGRSGSASLALRALIDKQDRTVLELTTGNLDGGSPAPGEIVHTQLKILDSAGTTLAVVNDHPSGSGSVAYNYEDLRRGQPLEVQANVRGIDEHRTDVVTVRDAVRARPDLAVASVTAPQTVTRNMLVNIAAVLAELNGDAGARADCVLYADEVEVDRAEGIWVDAGDEVSCAFTHVFDTLGTRTLRVAALSVTPGDWDEANNSATASIKVVNPQRPYDYAEANFGETDFSETTFNRLSYDNFTYGSTYELTYIRNGWSESGFYRGQLFSGLSLPIDITAAISDGTRENRSAWRLTAPDYYYWGGSGYCGVASRYDHSAARTQFLTFQTCPSGPTVLYYQRYAGVVTYLSTGWVQSWYIMNGDTYTSYWTVNSSWGSDTGNERLTGSTISYDVSIATADLTFRRPLDVAVTPYTNRTSEPLRCYTWSSPWGRGEQCRSVDGWARGTFGYVHAGTIPDEDLP